MGCMFCIEESSLGMVETLGKFSNVAHPGLHCINPCLSELKGVINMRIRQLSDVVSVNTSDSVALRLRVNVQFRVSRPDDSSRMQRREEKKRRNGEDEDPFEDIMAYPMKKGSLRTPPEIQAFFNPKDNCCTGSAFECDNRESFSPMGMECFSPSSMPMSTSAITPSNTPKLWLNNALFAQDTIANDSNDSFFDHSSTPIIPPNVSLLSPTSQDKAKTQQGNFATMTGMPLFDEHSTVALDEPSPDAPPSFSRRALPNQQLYHPNASSGASSSYLNPKAPPAVAFVPTILHIQSNLEDVDALLDHLDEEGRNELLLPSDRYAFQAFYTLSDADEQIMHFVLSSIRSLVSMATMEDVFGDPVRITSQVYNAVSQELSTRGFGYTLLSVHIIDVRIQDPKVKKACNGIMTAYYSRMTTQYRAESDQIKTVILSQAHAEAERLSGVGLAQARNALAGMMVTLRDLIDVEADEVGQTKHDEKINGNHMAGNVHNNGVPKRSTSAVPTEYTAQLLKFAQFFSTLTNITHKNHEPVITMPVSMDSVAHLRKRMNRAIHGEISAFKMLTEPETFSF